MSTKKNKFSIYIYVVITIIGCVLACSVNGIKKCVFYFFTISCKPNSLEFTLSHFYNSISMRFS